MLSLKKVRTLSVTHKTFHLKDYKSYDEARKAAEEHQKQYNKEKNLSKNDYRHVDADTIEAKLTQGFLMRFDKQFLPILLKQTWCASVTTDGTNVYARAGYQKSRIEFHTQVLPSKDNLITDHINGTVITGTNILDNRLANLRLVTIQVQNRNKCQYTQRNNTSGLKGLHEDKKRHCWQAAMQVNRETISKCFYYGSQSIMNREQAKQKAIEYRKYLETKYASQICNRPREDFRKRKAEVDPQIIKRTTTTVGLSAQSQHNKKQKPLEEDKEDEIMIA